MRVWAAGAAVGGSANVIRPSASFPISLRRPLRHPRQRACVVCAGSSKSAYGTFFCAQAAQMQAAPRAGSGRLAISAGSNLTSVHQQGGCLTPVACSASIAH